MVDLILDTDIGNDCDDAGAIALMHHLADQDKCNILAVTQCTSRLDGAQAADALNRYFGRGDIPVGTYLKAGFLDDEAVYGAYSRAVAKNFEHADEFEEAVSLLRRTLAAAKDDSVTLAAIGPLGNIARLLSSPPDTHSDLDGVALCQKKVHTLVCMGGYFEDPDHPIYFEGERLKAEWNIKLDVKSAQAVAAKWPTKLVLLPYEAGCDIKTGAFLFCPYDPKNPVALSYEVFCGGERESWDQLTLLHAILPDKKYFDTSPMGEIGFDEQGVSTLRPCSGGRHCYLTLRQNQAALAEEIDRLMGKQ